MLEPVAKVIALDEEHFDPALDFNRSERLATRRVGNPQFFETVQDGLPLLRPRSMIISGDREAPRGTPHKDYGCFGLGQSRTLLPSTSWAGNTQGHIVQVCLTVRTKHHDL